MSIRRIVSIGVATLTALSGVAAFAEIPALAAYTPSGSFGSATSTPKDPEPLSEPSRIAVNQSNGDVYVVDVGAQRVERFDASGNYLGQWDGAGTPAGSFEFPTPEQSDVAVDNSTSATDPSAGDVYVFDYGHRAIDKFTASGSYVSQIELEFEPSIEDVLGIAVDQTGNLWTLTRTNTEATEAPGELREYSNAAGNPEIAHTPLPPIVAAQSGLAVDANDNLYLEAHGACKFAGAEGVLEGCLKNQSLDAVSVDPVTDYVYLVTNGSEELQVFDTSALTSEASEALPIATIPPGTFKSSLGVAVNGLAGKVYISNGSQNEIDVFRFPVLPGLTAKPVSSLSASSATLNATVNPVGRNAHTIEFEYGTSSAYGSTLAANPSEMAPGITPAPISATLTGLVPNTLYHYRLLASNEEGTSSTPDLTFLTQPAAARVNDTPAFAARVGQFEATLHGTINPGNGVTSYHFEYGTTSAYGSSIPVPEGFTPVNYEDDAVSEQLGGLRAGTTYHFALVATNGAGTVTGPDETFTTLPVPPPLVTTGGASAITRGEALLSGTIDPRGWNTSYRFEYGTTSAYGSSWPTVDVELGAFTGAQLVSITVLNLLPGTTYHYRLVATNGGGTSYGPDMTFTTAEYPASVVAPTPLLSASLGFFNPEQAVVKKAQKKKKKQSHRRAHGKTKGRRKHRK